MNVEIRYGDTEYKGVYCCSFCLGRPDYEYCEYKSYYRMGYGGVCKRCLKEWIKEDKNINFVKVYCEDDLSLTRPKLKAKLLNIELIK